ncbi:MAG: hypothetical protein JF612_14275, partial [Planctomycetia bacterium]|nr:hypothetical protein [Planctomycetia bacterium]
DEAHTLEAVAGDHLGLSITSGQMQFILNKLYNDRTNKGLLLTRKLRAAQDLVVECHMRADELFGDAWQLAQHPANRTGRILKPNLIENRLSPLLVKLARELRQAAKEIESESERLDFTSAHDRITGLAGELTHWIEQQSEGLVYWIEGGWGRGGRPRVGLSAAPVDVGPVLREHLFEKTRSVIMTSATLAIGQPPRFDFYKSRIGLTSCETLRAGSPFNFREQAKLIIVRGLPDPTAEKEKFEKQTIPLIKRYVERTDGHAFVLFTSYESLRRAAAALSLWLAIRAAGGNPFRDYQLPEAVIKLRQGFGRLIRTQQDRGIVVMLDPRLRTKPYGRVFLQSLPDCEVVEESVEGEARTVTGEW